MEVTTPSSCFTPTYFTPFYLNTPCQFTPFLNLHFLISSLTPFGWLCSIMLPPYFWWQYHFWFMPTFSEMQLGHKTRAGYNFSSHNNSFHQQIIWKNKKSGCFPKTELCEEKQKNMVLVRLLMGTGKEAKPNSCVQPELQMNAWKKERKEETKEERKKQRPKNKNAKRWVKLYFWASYTKERLALQ